MIIEPLIEKLQEIQKDNPGIRVCTFDWRQSIHHADSDGNGIGVHDFTSVTLITGEDKPEDSVDWVAIDHENWCDYDEEGNKLED